MKALKVIGFLIMCGLINVRNVDSCCCNVLPHPDGSICWGPCRFDCNYFGCNCGTIDGHCVHYPFCYFGIFSNFAERCAHPHKGATKNYELCDAPFVLFSMLDSNSDGVISHREATEHLIKENTTMNTRLTRTQFETIDVNKDGYIQPNEFDNDLKIDKPKFMLLKVD